MDRPRPKSCVSTASSGSVLSLRALRKRLEETTTSFPNNHKTRNDQAIDGINGFKSNRPVTTQMASNEDSVAQLIQRRSRSNSAVHLQRTRAFSSRNTRSISAVELPSRATSRLKEHEEEEEDEDAIPDEVAGLQGIKLYERRRSALPKLDTNGNISYAQRKNMRRGSLFYAQSRPRSKMVEMDTDDEVEDVSLSDQMTIPGLAAKRQSLQIPSQLYFSNDKRRRSRSDSIRSGGSSERLDMMTEDGPPVNFNRRRRGSRMPASLAKDVEMLVPPVRKSNPEARSKVARYFRIVKVCVALCRWSYSRGEEKRESFLGFAQVDSEEHNLEKLFFNPSYFKANRQQRLNEETKYVLSLSPWKRTTEQTRYVQIALRNIRAFAEYPIDMQYKLCRVGWFEEYNSKRVILRQGHLPDSFYFIIAGTLVVTVLDISKGKPMAQTVAFLKRGDSFGELAILNNTRRASTVITKNIVQLLCISVEDFEDIFMLAGGMKSVSDPTRNSLIRDLNMFQHWPLQELGDHPQDCLFHFFKHGDVLVKDSRYSDWIYIVKSGSCSVLKKLKRTKPKISSKFRRQTSAMKWNKGNTLGLVGLRSSTVSIPKQHKPRCDSAIPSSRRQRRHSWTSKRRQRPTTAPPTTRTSSAKQAAGGNIKTVSPVTSTDSDVSLPSSKKHTSGKTDELKSVEEEDDIPEDFVNQKRTFHTDLDGPKMMTDENDDDDIDPVFIVIQVLTRGIAFGLHDAVFNDQPNLTVVSNGAECIMIRKRFYLEHATDETFAFMRRQETPYPSNAELQEKLQIFHNWNSFRNHTLKSTIYETRAHKQQRLYSCI